MPYRGAAFQALDRWHDAQRRRAAASPDSAEWKAAIRDAEIAKGDYEWAVQVARQRNLPEPPAFDEAIRGD